MDIHKLLPLGLCFLLLGALAEAAMAPPPMPQVISGNVYIDGKPAPAGTNITLKVRENIIASTIVQTAGEYDIALGYDGSDKLEFFVNGIKASEADYAPGTLTSVDLSVKTSGVFLPMIAAALALAAILALWAKRKKRRQ